MSAEIELLFCCPACSVMPPAGVVFTGPQMAGAFRPVRLWQGRRSGKFWLHRPVGCGHRLELDGVRETPDVVGQWNDWARAEAEVQAERRGITGERRTQWLYNLGIYGLPKIIAATA